MSDETPTYSPRGDGAYEISLVTAHGSINCVVQPHLPNGASEADKERAAKKQAKELAQLFSAKL